MRIRLSKTATVRPGAVYASAPATPAPMPPAPAAPASGSTPAAEAAPAAGGNTTEVKSPMVGTYYGAPEPGAKPYVSVGQQVKQGQVLCIIEAMKIMNEIESEVSGTIVEVCAADAHPVEYGQVLFRVRPNG
jgi:acetyl-CoA carboxylase biotin carboxyl carrier protein